MCKVFLQWVNLIILLSKINAANKCRSHFAGIVFEHDSVFVSGPNFVLTKNITENPTVSGFRRILWAPSRSDHKNQKVV